MLRPTPRKELANTKLYEYETREYPPLPDDFPYQVGQSFSIRRHRAPPPFGGGRYIYAKGLRQHTDYWRAKPPLNHLTLLERCLRHPPQDWPADADDADEADEETEETKETKETEERNEKDKLGERDKPNGASDETKAYDARADTVTDTDRVYTLHIVDHIAARVGHGAQVLRCRVDGLSDEPRFVAKIYDAAYYNEDSFYSGDVSLDADKDYAYEVAAYAHLQSEGADGRYTPKYYGSFTLDLPVPQDGNSERPATRPVRLVILEYIAGTDMFKMLINGDIDKVPMPRRLEIMAEVMEDQCALEFLGLFHTDLEPRNVIVLDKALYTPAETDTGIDTGTNTSTRSVVIIDFNKSYIAGSPWMSERRWQPRLTALCSPIHRFWGQVPSAFAAWIPHIYHIRVPAFNGWLKHRWASTINASGYYVPSPLMQERYKYDAATEYVPPESIVLPETPIPSHAVYTLGDDRDAKQLAMPELYMNGYAKK